MKIVRQANLFYTAKPLICDENAQEYGNFDNIRILQQLPILNSFELSVEETEIMKEFNSSYYGKKEDLTVNFLRICH